jgi:hypothetical protein
MKITINTLVNQVKKVISNKSSVPALEKAYINNNGDIIASNIEVTAFIAGVFQDAAAENLNKLYSKEALTIYAKTGVLAGGVDFPESAAGCFKLPEEEFTTICTVTTETMKSVISCVSRNDSRAYLTGFNVNMDAGFIESVDGFRAYRVPVDIVGRVNRSVVIPGFAGSFGYKGNIEIAAGEKYARLTDTITGLIVYARLLNVEKFVNLDAIYNKNANYRTVTVKGLETIKPFLQAAIKAGRAERGAGATFLRFKDNRLDYSIPGIDICGSLETDVSDMEAAAACYNPAYLLDAITAAGDTVVYDTKGYHNAPVTIGKEGGPEALILPIREDSYTVNGAFKKIDIIGNRKQEAETRPDNTEITPAPDPVKETTEAAPVPDSDPDPDPDNTAAPAPVTDSEAVKELNEKQNKENRFTNITPEDVKRQQAIKAAQGYYKALQGYKLTALQEITATAIYKANKAVLQPIARQAGGLYIDSLSIMAAITAAAELYKLQEV